MIMDTIRPRNPVLTWSLYPLLLVASLCGSWTLQWLGLASGPSVSVAILIPALVIQLIERRAPHHPSWRPGRRTWLVDLSHSLLSSAAVPSLLHAATIGALHAGTEMLLKRGLDLWPNDAPLGLQLLGALLVAEWGTYWAHRSYHELLPLWPIHAVHHSAERMHSLAAGRTHPINIVTTFFVGTAPLVLLGAPIEVIAFLNVFTGVNGLLQHANIDMRLGLLAWIFAGPDLHHYHHSRLLAESNANYGSNLIVWDVVFGTRHAPAGERPSTELGLNEASLPDHFWLHLRLPFTYKQNTRRYQRSTKTPPTLSPATTKPGTSWPDPPTRTPSKPVTVS
jgi:sterol desaturase/sphingolipid hydroxylase (fatty acid hydroxylase superfamily)